VAGDRVQQQNRIDALAAEMALRKQDGLTLYRPRPEQVPFHRSKASERIIRGGNRSGKTTAAVAEIASALLRQPIVTWEGETLAMGWPTDRPLLMWFVGFDEKHIARMYKKLFKEGAYKILRDRMTNAWRAWRPWEADDLAREDACKRSQPLVPPRMVEQTVWAHAGEQVPSVTRMKNGTEIQWFSSGSEAAVGDAVDAIWIDEDVKYPEHVSEWQARLSDNRGRLVWSSWPRGKNPAMRAMVKRAEEQADWETPDVQCWTLTHSGNPYIPKAEREKRVRAWKAAGEGVYLARDLGLFADGLVQVFSNFDLERHTLPVRGEPDPIEKALRATKDMLPRDWTYYLALDPGHAHAAAVVAMVPPTPLGKAVIVRHAFYFERYDHYQIAEAIAERYGHVVFQAFLIDWHAGRTSTIGRGERPYDLYVEAFEKAGLKSVWTDSGFAHGSDNVAARNMIVRQWLDATTHGVPRLRLVRDDTYPMQREFDLYRKKVSRDDVKEAVVPKDDHTMDCIGYLMAYLKPLFDAGEAWQPAPKDVVMDPVRKALEALRKENQPPTSDSFYFGPGIARDPYPVAGAA